MNGETDMINIMLYRIRWEIGHFLYATYRLTLLTAYIEIYG
jgi:hypothetical protein